MTWKSSVNWNELIIHVPVVAQAGEQHHGPRVVRAAPVQHLKMDSAVNVDEGLFVWRAIEACERLNGAMLPARESVSEANRANEAVEKSVWTHSWFPS